MQQGMRVNSQVFDSFNILLLKTEIQYINSAVLFYTINKKSIQITSRDNK